MKLCPCRRPHMLGRRRIDVAALVRSATASAAASEFRSFTASSQPSRQSSITPFAVMGTPSTMSRADARRALLSAVSAYPMSGVVRRTSMACKKRACFRRAIPQIGRGQQATRYGHLRPTAPRGVKRVPALRIAEPLRRAALARLEPGIAPEADRLHRSGGDQPGTAVHQCAPQPSLMPQDAVREQIVFYPISDQAVSGARGHSHRACYARSISAHGSVSKRRPDPYGQPRPARCFPHELVVPGAQSIPMGPRNVW